MAGDLVYRTTYYRNRAALKQAVAEGDPVPAEGVIERPAKMVEAYQAVRKMVRRKATRIVQVGMAATISPAAHRSAIGGWCNRRQPVLKIFHASVTADNAGGSHKK